MDGNFFYDGWLDGSMLMFLFGRIRPHDGQTLHGVEDIPSVEQAAKDCMQIVQMRLLVVQYKEL